MKNEIIKFEEPYVVPEFFVVGIGSIEELPGPCLRFTMVSLGGVEGVPENTPVAQYKAIIPVASLRTMFDQCSSLHAYMPQSVISLMARVAAAN